MSRQADVIVLGAGIAGSTMALAFADGGATVLVVDRLLEGAASRPSAGLLAPSLGGLPSALLPTAFEARDFYPAYLDTLTGRTGRVVPLDRRGIIELDGVLRAPGSIRLTGADLNALEPDLRASENAVFHPADGSVDNMRLQEVLDLSLAAHDRISALTTTAISVAVRADHVCATTAAGDTVCGRWVVVAAGAWSAHLRGLPRDLPVRPLRGQLARLDQSPLSHVVAGPGGYLVPRGSSTVIGATSEDVGFQLGTSSAGLAELRRAAETTVPAFAGAATVDHWAAFRPMTPDGLPILGPDPAEPSVLYACGYSRNGILFAPWTAHVLARGVLAGNQDPRLAPFSVARFG